jgi:predicted esterase
VNDPILSVRTTREDIVPALEKKGCPVTYREHAGGHVVPDELRLEAMLWAAG